MPPIFKPPDPTLIETHEWKKLETKGKRPVGRLQHASALHNKRLYVFGGEPN